MIGTMKSMEAAIVHVIMHPTIGMSLLLDDGKYVVANGYGMPGLITIDPEFSDSVNYFRASTGGVADEFILLIHRHVEMLEWVHPDLIEKPEVLQ